MSLGTTIKTIQDIMRQDSGVDGDAQRISQLVWMIFLKVFDDRPTAKNPEHLAGLSRIHPLLDRVWLLRPLAL